MSDLPLKQPVDGRTDLQHQWSLMAANRGDIISRSALYARWTLPHIFPENGPNQTTTSDTLKRVRDSIGARGVNHMSNKVVTTLFRPQGAFFRLSLGEEAEKQIQAAAAQGSGEDARQALSEVESSFASAEKQAQEELDMVVYRPTAINATKLLIITGNALMFHPDNSPAQVYSLHNYCVERDISGKVVKIMTKETKAFSTFDPEMQGKLRSARVSDPYEDKSEVTIYTCIKLNGHTRKFDVTQAADMVDVSVPGMAFPAETLPWIPLTWNMVTGEDYGRGLVEDYAGAFHALEVLNESLLNIVTVMGDIKIFINPNSGIDVRQVNQSKAGTYIAGDPKDIGAPELGKFNDAQFVQAQIERYERQISQGFLLNGTAVRDAERVTAEEVRMMANELDTSNGGVYSRLAHQWQLPTARILLNHMSFPAEQWGVKVSIITGMDSLSRLGELDNIQMFMNDLAILNNVPDDVRAAIDIQGYMTLIGEARQIEYQRIIKSQERQNAEQQQAMAEQQAMMQAEGQQQVAIEAGKAAAQG